MRKKFLAVGMVLVMLAGSCFQVAVYAGDEDIRSSDLINDEVDRLSDSSEREDDPILRWTTINQILLSLSFSGGKANCSAQILGKSNVTSISSTYTLRKKDSSGTFTTIKTWDLKTSGKNQGFSGSYAVSSGYTYRFRVSTTVKTSAGTTETITDYIDKKY